MIADVPAPTWVHVVTVAGRRCECTGVCGHDHTIGAGDGRCPTGHPGRERITRDRLVAAPANPSVPAHQAYRVPVEDLQAWCPGCLNRARRLAATTRYVSGPASLPLF